MADKFLAQLPSVTSIATDAIIPVETGGATSKILPDDFLRTLIAANAAKTVGGPFGAAGIRYVGTKTMGRDIYTTPESADDDYLRIDLTYSGQTIDSAPPGEETPSPWLEWSFQGSAAWIHTHATNNSTGSVHALSLSEEVDAGCAGEFSPFYIDFFCDAHGTATTVWGTDQKVFGPRLGAAERFVGQSLMVMNRHSVGASKPTHGFQVATFPQQDAWHAGGAHANFPLDVGLAITGWSGNLYTPDASNPAGPGFTVGIEIGGQPSVWGDDQGFVGTGILIKNWQAAGLEIGAGSRGSFGVGGVDGTKPALLLNGSLRLRKMTDSGGFDVAKPAAGSGVRGMLWFTEGGAGVADTLEMCMKAAAGSYSWKTIATG